MPRIQLTDNARQYRRLMWLVVVLSLPGLWLAIQGLRGLVPGAVGITAGLAFLAGIFLAAALGFKTHRQTMADREMQARRAMVVMLAATLGKQEDEALERIRAKGGLSGEAAGLILKNRHADTSEP